MLAPERAGILTWAVKGCLAWQKDGLNPPPAVRNAVAAYRSEMDVLGQWLNEKCDVGPEFSARSADLYANFELWRQGEGLHAWTKRKLTTELVDRKFTRERGTAGAATLLGLRPKPMLNGIARS